MQRLVYAYPRKILLVKDVIKLLVQNEEYFERELHEAFLLIRILFYNVRFESFIALKVKQR
jgi:hypothetical protein